MQRAHNPWIHALLSSALLAIAAGGCKSDDGGTDEVASEESSSTDADTGSDTGTSDDTTTEVDPTNGGECQFGVANDCMDPDLKCMPWSEKPDRIPDEARCCPLDPSPVSLGDRCHVKEYDGSCLDDCPAGTMCVIDLLDGLEGYCQEFCDPGVVDGCSAHEICKPFFELIEAAETVPLCMARCDPLLQDCADKGRPGWSCLPEGALSPSFLCMPPSGSTPKLEYEGCLLQNDCAVGLACVPATEVVGCDGLFNCCTRYCDASEANTCTMGNECINLESDVPGLENVGVCADPV